nr:uncharacterized protein LOC125180930 isoform X2 [Anser cygnoides]
MTLSRPASRRRLEAGSGKIRGGTRGRAAYARTCVRAHAASGALAAIPEVRGGSGAAAAGVGVGVALGRVPPPPLPPPPSYPAMTNLISMELKKASETWPSRCASSSSRATRLATPRPSTAVPPRSSVSSARARWAARSTSTMPASTPSSGCEDILDLLLKQQSTLQLVLAECERLDVELAFMESYQRSSLRRFLCPK